MERKKWFSPYDPTRRIGSVISVSATELIINLSKAGSGEPSWSFGNRIAAGEVNEFVFIDIGETAILGRLVKVWIEGGERLSVDGLADKPSENHPIGLVQLLVSLNPANGRNYKGIKQHPRLGSQIYSAHPYLVAIIAEGKQDEEPGQIHLPLASLPHDESVTVHVTPEKLFSRHCAILGATGGGKSYSMTNIIEQVIKAGGKAIIIDPTGEYESLGCDSYYVGNHAKATPFNQLTFPHWQFTDSDIRAFLRPSAQSQAPKLEAAIESQKIVWQFWQKQNHGLDFNANYLLNKSGQAKAPYEAALLSMNSSIQTAPWMFKNIADQIVNECVWPNGGNANNPNPTIWGGRADNDVGHFDAADDWNKCCVGIVLSQFRQAQGKPRTGNDYVRTAFAGGAHKGIIIGKSAHAVDSDDTAVCRCFRFSDKFFQHYHVLRVHLFRVVIRRGNSQTD